VKARIGRQHFENVTGRRVTVEDAVDVVPKSFKHL